MNTVLLVISEITVKPTILLQFNRTKMYDVNKVTKIQNNWKNMKIEILHQ